MVLIINQMAGFVKKGGIFYVAALSYQTIEATENFPASFPDSKNSS